MVEVSELLVDFFFMGIFGGADDDIFLVRVDFGLGEVDACLGSLGGSSITHSHSLYQQLLGLIQLPFAQLLRSLSYARAHIPLR